MPAINMLDIQKYHYKILFTIPLGPYSQKVLDLASSKIKIQSERLLSQLSFVLKPYSQRVI